MALTKVSAAMFSTAAQSSDMNMDDGTLFVDVSENKVAIGNTAPTEALDITGNLTLRSRGYLKLQDDAGGQFVALRAPATVSSSVTYTFPAADGSSGQTLSTDGSGTLSWATVAPTAGTGVTVSGTAVSIGQAVATSDSPTFTNLTLSGNLTVNGSTVTNSATNTTIEDLLIELGTGTSGSPASDAGLVLERGSSDNIFIGWDESADVFTVGTGSFTGASSGNLTHTAANAVFGSITGSGLTIDTATLVVDASNNRVGIGNASPDVSLDIGSYTDAVHVPVGTTAQRPGSPAAGYFRYNSTTSQFEGYTSSWGAIGGGSTTLTTDLFTGNGSTVDFTTSQAVDSENKLMVFIDGVYQNPDAYSMPATTTLRFSAAPASGRKIAVYSIAGVVSGTNLNIDSFTGDGSDLTFTLSIAPVNENNTLVYVGGVYQQKSVYSVSGTTLTFGSGNAPPNGASIEVATFNQTNINVPVDDTITTAKIVNDAVTADKIVDNIALPGNITTTGTLAPTGALTANAGVVVDNITIDGTEIDLSSGDLTIDVAGDIILDAAGSDVRFHNAGTLHGRISNDSSGLWFVSDISDKDIYIRGNDGGSMVTALTFDMSEAGAATFNSEVLIPEKLTHAGDTDTHFKFAGANDIRIVAGNVEHAAFDGTIVFNQSGADMDFRVESNSNANMLFVDAGNDRVGIGTNAPTAPLTVLSNSGANAIRMFGRSADNYSELYASSNDGGTNYFFIQGHSAQTKLWTLGSTPISLGTNSTEVLTITSGGNIGINNTSPSSYYARTLMLDGGTGNTVAIHFENSTTGSGNGRGMDVASDGTNFNIVNREVGAIALHTGPVGSPALGFNLDTNGHVRMPKQSSWAGTSADMNSFSANVNTIQFNSNRFDQNADFNTSNYTFTAPTTGRYLVCCNLYLKNMDNSAAYYQLYVETSNKVYYSIYDPEVGTDSQYWDMTWSGVVDMDESDTVVFKLNQSGGAAQSSIDGQTFASVSLLH